MWPLAGLVTPVADLILPKAQDLTSFVEGLDILAYSWSDVPQMFCTFVRRIKPGKSGSARRMPNGLGQDRKVRTAFQREGGQDQKFSRTPD